MNYQILLANLLNKIISQHSVNPYNALHCFNGFCHAPLRMSTLLLFYILVSALVFVVTWPGPYPSHPTIVVAYLRPPLAKKLVQTFWNLFFHNIHPSVDTNSHDSRSISCDTGAKIMLSGHPILIALINFCNHIININSGNYCPHFGAQTVFCCF